MQALTSAIQYVDSDTGRNYTVRLIPENTLTDDPSNRYPVGPIGWRDGRLPFTFSDVEGEPHEEARHVGNLFNLRREEIDGTVWVVADLDWDSDELALEAKRLVDEDRITGVSIHGTDLDAYLICGVPEAPSAESVKALAGAFDPSACPETEWVEAWVGLVIGSATLLMLPAFEDAEVITAAVDLMRPRADWFEKEETDEPTEVIVTEEGQVYGHLTEKDCHRGFFDSCVLPPDDAANFEEFHNNGTVYLDNGETLRVGNLTIDVNHADVRTKSEIAKAHYDNSGAVVAQVRAKQGKFGIWLAGAIAPWATRAQIEKLRRLRLSGDWRPTRDGRHFLIAAQAVPVPGFPIRARVAGGVISEYTTLGPDNPLAYEDAVVAGASEEALVASAVQHLVNEIRELRGELELDRKLREYEKALAVFN